MRHAAGVVLLVSLLAGVPAAVNAQSAVKELPQFPSRVSAGMVMPVAAPRDADRAWAEIAAIIELTPKLRVAGPFPGSTAQWTGFTLVQETANRVLQELGMRFYEQYPKDPRRWIWFEAALDRRAFHIDLEQVWRAREDASVKPQRDQAQWQAWNAAVERLRDECIADTTAPEQLRAQVWIEKLHAPLRRLMSELLSGKPNLQALDFEQLGAETARLAEAFPELYGDPLRNYVNAYLGYADRYAPDTGEKWRQVFVKGPNAAIRDLASGRAALDAARARPMDLRFTAIDGREVDLADLRGKVVLLDFRGVTWCGACRAEEPYMKAAYGKYHNQGFEILTITFENDGEDRAFVENYVQEKGLVWPHYFDGKGARNPFIRRFGITGVPQHYLINRNGLVVNTDVRGRKLEPAVRKLLELPPLADSSG